MQSDTRVIQKVRGYKKSQSDSKLYRCRGDAKTIQKIRGYKFKAIAIKTMQRQ
jgi:hypothetical protein